MSLWDFAVPAVVIEGTSQIYNPVFVNRGQSTRWLIHAHKQFYPPLISGKAAIKDVCSADSWFISLLFCFSSWTGLWSMHLVHPRTRNQVYRLHLQVDYSTLWPWVFMFVFAPLWWVWAITGWLFIPLYLWSSEWSRSAPARRSCKDRKWQNMMHFALIHANLPFRDKCH